MNGLSNFFYRYINQELICQSVMFRNTESMKRKRKKKVTRIRGNFLIETIPVDAQSIVKLLLHTAGDRFV